MSSAAAMTGFLKFRKKSGGSGGSCENRPWYPDYSGRLHSWNFHFYLELNGNVVSVLF